MPTPSNAIEINDGSHKSGRSTRRSGSRSAHDDGLDSFSKGDSGAGASAGSSNSRFRHRKISVKQHLKIYLPNDLKHLDKDELQQREVLSQYVIHLSLCPTLSIFVFHSSLSLHEL